MKTESLSKSEIVQKPKKLKLRIPKQGQKAENVDELKDGKKDFRKTCLICLYEFQSESNFNTDQIRHQQAFGDMEQSVSCPLCQERYLITQSITDIGKLEGK